MKKILLVLFFLLLPLNVYADEPIYLPLVIKPVSPPSSLRITALFYHGDDEYVEVTNFGGPQLMGGWVLHSVVGDQGFGFPPIVLYYGQRIYLHSGPSSFQSIPEHWRWSTSYIWDDSGDKARLLNPQHQVVSEMCYLAGC